MTSQGNDSIVFSFKPIGFFQSIQKEKYMAPRQPEWGNEGKEGVIILSPGNNYEQALEGLEGFERIWVVYLFDRNAHWKPKVATPRGGTKRGVFATRSPHRPNPIGISCVRLLGIKGREVHIDNNDLLDGTPILDIKPYLNYSDAFPESRQGWLETESVPTLFNIEWSPLSNEQLAFIGEGGMIDLRTAVEQRLSTNPFPFKNHRIKQISENCFQLAVKTWRFNYTVEGSDVTIQNILSGYTDETLKGNSPSRWNDVTLHQTFVKKFSR